MMNGQDTESDEKLIVADHQMNAFLERAKKPIVWTRLPFGIRIEDLHPAYYEEVIDLIKCHYVPDEPMFNALNVSKDEESLDEFLSFCNVWINDTCSIVAIEEGEKKAVGALIGRVYIKRDMNREFARMPDDSKSPTPEPEKPKKGDSRKSLRRQSKKSIRRQSKKSIRRQSKKSIRRQSKKSIRRQSKKSIRRQSKKSIRRQSKKSIRRQSKKSIRRQSTKGGRRMSSKGKTKGDKKPSDESIKKKKPERIYKFNRPEDKIPEAPQAKKTTTVFDDDGILHKTEPLQKIQKLRNFVAKKYDVFESLSKNKYYKIYLIVVHRDYRRKGIGKTLLRSLFGLCSGFRIDVTAGIFTSYVAQNMAFKLGGKVAFEMNYDDWVIAGDTVFSNVPDPNYSIALMYLTIPQAEEGHYGDKVQVRPPIPRRADISDRILV